ncbi:MAG: DoxX family protein [Micromonosporaceae bacterium]
MATDPPCPARPAARHPDDPPSDLVVQVHHHSRTVIEAEMRRLARRAPSLQRADLDVIAATLEELAEALLLARLRNAPQHTAPLLRPLFEPAGPPRDAFREVDPITDITNEGGIMNVALWIAASTLAVVFLGSGATKLSLSRETIIAWGFTWAEDFSTAQVKLIGAVEVLGALGLIVPAALGIVETLSPLAAAGLAVVMAGAAIVHLRRNETKLLAGPLVLGGIAAVLAVLRFGLYSF